MEYFDSYDWKTIKNLIKKLKEKGGIYAGTTQREEIIVFGLGGKNTLVTSTFQQNGWIRINTYNCDEHTITETYEKGE